MTPLSADTILAAADAAQRLIPPAWPLAATVAVNPFLGHARDSLAEAQQRLGRAAGLRLTMPRGWYAAKIASGEIADDDLAAAIAMVRGAPSSTEALKRAALAATPAARALPTIASLAAAETGRDIEAIVADRIGAWAGSYFDEGQAHWAAARGGGAEEGGSAWASWQSFATHDLTPEIRGISSFAAHAAGAPQRADEAIICAAASLRLEAGALPAYFHALLMSLGGWAHLARWRLWQAELAGGADNTLRDLLAIRLTFETAVHALHADRIAAGWAEAVRAYGLPVLPDADDAIDAALQEAAERAHQRRLVEMLDGPPAATPSAGPLVQAAFCIDVRSEVFRRALESVDPGIETIGFAGFFGLPLAHRRFGSRLTEAHLPVLLRPAARTCHAVTPELEEKEETLRIAARARRAWSRFQQAAVSSFAFVEAAGPLYAGKLVASALRLGGGAEKPEPAPRLDPEIPVETRVSIAKTVLGAMSMKGPFAPLVLLAGHGARVVNNAHASALHCGACGGQTGEVSARTLASLLNEPEVRKGLAAEGIVIPPETLVVGALHDTTSDEVTLLDADQPSPAHADQIARLRRWLSGAAVAARTERALKMPLATGQADLAKRGRDWSEVRPEWGLAGCSTFIAAPRHRTAGRNLGGRAFLHSYDWRADKDFSVLELIMTAPVVVASWISLQYYGSVVAPQAFGAGNKLLHNVVGGVGVLEGNGGAPRVGLPWQSVHDGERLVHDPLRLTVLVEAPREAITEVLRRHEGVRALFDNRWLHLLVLDAEGRIGWRYAGGLAWEPAAGPLEARRKAA
jgi:uncharacterized protein YbcC (UPF0753/DUF2309 family)